MEVGEKPTKLSLCQQNVIFEEAILPISFLSLSEPLKKNYNFNKNCVQ